MPPLSVIIDANSKPFQKEVAEAEAIALGFSKTVPKAMEGGFRASFRNIKAEFDTLAGFKSNLGAVRGSGMMSDAESVASEERVRLIQVEEAARSNAARRLWRQRAESRAATKAEAEEHRGLNAVLRESMVVMREIWHGDWSRAARSGSKLTQELKRMRAELGIFGALFTVTGAAVVGSVAAIVGAFVIWHYRVKNLTAALTGLSRVEMPKPDISRLSAYEEGWRRIRDLIAEAADEINSANDKFTRTVALLDQAQHTESKLLEIQKQKDMDEAGNDPAKKVAVREKYLKQEHDLEVKQQKEKLAADEKHIMDLSTEENEKTQQAKDIKVATEADEKVNEETFKKQVEKNNAREKDKDGKEIEGSSPMEKAQATVDRLESKKKDADKTFNGTFGPIKGDAFTETNQAELDEARKNLETGQTDQRKLNEYQLTKKDREDARTEQKRLFDEAAKAGADKIKAEKDYNSALFLNKRILADDDKLRAAEADEKDTKDEFKSGGHNIQMNSQQRLGAYLAAPPEFKKMAESLKKIEQNTGHLKPSNSHPVHSRPVGYGPGRH